MNIDIQEVIRGYVECLLWSQSCNGTALTGDGHEHNTNDPVGATRATSGTTFC